MGAYSGNRADLERMVNRVLSQKKIAETVFRSTAFLNVLFKNMEKLTGTYIETPVVTGSTGTAKMFSVEGTNDGTVGGGAAVTFVEPKKHKQIRQEFKPAGDTIRISKIRMRQASGPEALLNWLKAELKLPVTDLRQLISQQVLTGDDSVTTEDMNGLEQHLDNAGSLGGVVRSTARSLIANVFDATDTETDAGTGTKTAAIASVATEAAAKTVAGVTTTWVTDGKIKKGGKFTLGGTTYVVASVDSETQLTLATPASATVAATTSWTYRGAFYSTSSSRFGGAGVLTKTKMNRMLASARDGNEVIDLVICNTYGFEAFENILMDQQRVVGRSNAVGVKNYRNFLYSDAAFTIDNHVADGTFYGNNMDHVKLIALKGYHEFQLDEDGLMPDPTGNARQSLVGDIAFVSNLVIDGHNRCAKMSGVDLDL